MGKCVSKALETPSYNDPYPAGHFLLIFWYSWNTESMKLLRLADLNFTPIRIVCACLCGCAFARVRINTYANVSPAPYVSHQILPDPCLFTSQKFWWPLKPANCYSYQFMKNLPNTFKWNLTNFKISAIFTF